MTVKLFSQAPHLGNSASAQGFLKSWLEFEWSSVKIYCVGCQETDGGIPRRERLKDFCTAGMECLGLF